MPGISFSGIGSGLPVEDLVKASVQARAEPLQRMQRDQQQAQEQISAYGQLSSRIGELQSAMSDLKGESNFNQLSAATSNENLFTATASHDGGAVEGNYNIQVESEAQNYRWVSQELAMGEEPDLLTGSLDIKVASADEGVTIALPEEGASLEEVRAAINNHEELQGVAFANLVNTGDDQARLTINSTHTGDANALEIDTSRLEVNSQSTPATGIQTDNSDLMNENDLDARITVDGIEASSSTNSFNDIITGVDIQITEGALNDASANQSGVLNVSQDQEQIKDNIYSFVDAYNNVVTFLNQARQPQVNEQGQEMPGPLQGEGSIQSIQQQLRSVLDTPAGSDPNDFGSYLSHLGITTQVELGEGSEGALNNGMLEIDSARLDRVLDEDFESVAFILGDEQTGYAARMEQAAERLISDTVVDGRISRGLINTREQSLDAEINRIQDRMETTMDRLDAYEDRLFRQFNSIESVTANLNAQGEQLQEQFAGLPGY